MVSLLIKSNGGALTGSPVFSSLLPLIKNKMKKQNNNFLSINEMLEIKKIPNYKKRFKLSMIVNVILSIVVLVFIVIPRTNVIVRHIVVKDTVKIGDITPTDSSITSELVKNGCVLPNVAIAQARIETGNYTSTICKDNKNLFGITYHKCQYVVGKKHNHANYSSYKDNIKCYIHVQNAYLRNINGVYATAAGYVDMIKSMKK